MPAQYNHYTGLYNRYWLVDCKAEDNLIKKGTELYKETIAVPYMAKFLVFAKRLSPQESRIRLFCVVDDRLEKTLEKQENFQEVVRSHEVEVRRLL